MCISLNYWMFGISYDKKIFFLIPMFNKHVVVSLRKYFDNEKTHHKVIKVINIHQIGFGQIFVYFISCVMVGKW